VAAFFLIEDRTVETSRGLISGYAAKLAACVGKESLEKMRVTGGYYGKFLGTEEISVPDIPSWDWQYIH
jgi:hypothetical protein